MDQVIRSQGFIRTPILQQGQRHLNTPRAQTQIRFGDQLRYRAPMDINMVAESYDTEDDVPLNNRPYPNDPVIEMAE